jgi:hypothetical protein
MTFKITLLALFVLCIFSCNGPGTKPIQAGFERILLDTANNRRANAELERLAHYNNLCKAIGINKLYDGAGTFEVRVWRQFSVYGMAADEEIYSLKLDSTTFSLTFYRVYCAQENGNYNPYTEPKVDSFFAKSKSFPIKILDSMHLQDLWDLKTLSALCISDRIGFVDGAATSIEMASKSRYKFLTYHVAEAYYEKTARNEIKQYIEERDKLIDLFLANKVYDRNY